MDVRQVDGCTKQKPPTKCCSSRAALSSLTCPSLATLHDGNGMVPGYGHLLAAACARDEPHHHAESGTLQARAAEMAVFGGSDGPAHVCNRRRCAAADVMPDSDNSAFVKGRQLSRVRRTFPLQADYHDQISTGTDMIQRRQNPSGASLRNDNDLNNTDLCRRWPSRTTGMGLCLTTIVVER